MQIPSHTILFRNDCCCGASKALQGIWRFQDGPSTERDRHPGATAPRPSAPGL